MGWLRLRNVSFSYGGENLLEDVSLQVPSGERIGLLGRNGAGKSTLLKLLLGELRPESGVIERAPGTRIARLAQEVPVGTNHTVFDEVALGLGDEGALAVSLTAADAGTVPRAQNKSGGPAQRGKADPDHVPDLESAWKLHRQVDGAIDRLGLDPAAPFDTLSSGLKRRVLLARALASEPDVLLLDEPTNHLDIDAIGWLEEFLLRDARTLIFVTHDRFFLSRVATRIVEIERARLFDWTCDYPTFLVRKELALAGEARQEALFDKKLAEEEVWIRQGIKARRTRNEGRVRALERMREERRARRERTGNVRMQVQEAERSGNLVVAVQEVSHDYGLGPILKDFSATIYRGDKVGILGPNGSGKTTLLRILLGEIAPQRGTIRMGTNVGVAYFDQLRAQLDEEKSAVENVGQGKDMLTVNGRSRHVLGYLRDFLFSEDRARSLVRYLSGGERNRLLLARMFTRPANLLVFDEPTNDLDAETLELLEEMLVDYAGTLLLVSHDRAFLNNVVTSTLVFEGAGQVNEYVGGYDDWLRQRPSKPESPAPLKSDRARSRERSEGQRKLSNKQQRELDALPAKIEALEAEQAQLHQQMADPAFFRRPGTEIAVATDRLAEIERQLQAAYARWEALESLRDA